MLGMQRAVSLLAVLMVMAEVMTMQNRLHAARQAVLLHS